MKEDDGGPGDTAAEAIEVKPGQQQPRQSRLKRRKRLKRNQDSGSPDSSPKTGRTVNRYR